MADNPNIRSLFDTAKFQWSTLGRLYVVNVIRDQKLSGQVLGRRTGRLVRSVVSDSVVLEDRSGFSIGTNVIYGQAWEQGFTRPAYRIVARKAQALKIMTPGGPIFRKSAQIKAKTFGARPFMRPGLEDSMGYLQDLGGQLLLVAFNAAFPNRTIVLGGG